MSAAILCASSTLMPRGSANHPAKGDSSHRDKIPLSPSERDFRVKNAIQLAQGRQYQKAIKLNPVRQKGSKVNDS
jgi:hypothetical protein